MSYFLITFVLKYLVLLCQGIALFLSVPTFHLMEKEREKTDGSCFATMREVFEVLNFGCMSCLVPGDYLFLDETLQLCVHKLASNSTTQTNRQNMDYY